MKTAGITVSSGLFLCMALTSAQAQIIPAGPEPQPYDTPPVLMHPVLARYTAEARAANLSATVTVLLTVDVNGRPSHVRAIQTTAKGLDEAAINAVHSDRFKPAMKDGHPVSAQIKLDVTFDPAVNPGP